MSGRRARRQANLLGGDLREGTRGEGRPVLEVAGGVTVYPARFPGDRWRAVWHENGRRRECQSSTDVGLAERVQKITARLEADAPGLEAPGSELIAWYLSPARHPAGEAWSRKHADTQRRLCERFIAPVIGDLACEDIKVSHMQAAVNAAPTAGEGERLRRAIGALVTAGIRAGYLTTPRLKEVHWQPAENSEPAAAPVAIAGESPLYVEPGEIPSDDDVALLGKALAVQDPDYELMANLAAYSGLRWGEITAMTIGQVATGERP